MGLRLRARFARAWSSVIKATKTMTFCGNGVACISLICYFNIDLIVSSHFFVVGESHQNNYKFCITYLVYHFVGFSQTCVSHVARYGHG